MTCTASSSSLSRSPCLSGTRVTVGTIVGLVSAGSTKAEILDAYPSPHDQDVGAALAYAD